MTMEKLPCGGDFFPGRRKAAPVPSSYSDGYGSSNISAASKFKSDDINKKKRGNEYASSSNPIRKRSSY